MKISKKEKSDVSVTGYKKSRRVLMESVVVKIIEKYLEWEKIKQKKGYSDTLRLEYDDDANYYLNKGYSEDEALHADTIVSFWTIYKTLLEREAGWSSYKTPKSLECLLRQIRSKRENDYTVKIIKVNNKLEEFAKVIYTKGNYMLLPKRSMNNERYKRFEDRIDLTLFHSFSGGELSGYFERDELLRKWIIREKLDQLFKNGDVRKENILWLLDNEKKITEMDSSEIYVYINSAIAFIKNRQCRLHKLTI